MLERTRALYKLKAHEKCPGEHVCTTDTSKGMIASSSGRTLANYCHAEEGGCNLFFTKRDAIPVEFDAAVEVAGELRERSKLSGGKWLPPLNELPFWQLEAYRLNERVRMIVEHERIDNPDGSTVEVPKEHRDAIDRARARFGMSK